MLTPNFTR
jgi:enoyl-CoA hydratase/carnithine racemase